MSKKILIIGASWLGDMVMSQTLFIALKQQDPNCRIDVLAPKATHALLARMPEVNQAIDMPVSHGQFNLKARWQLAKYLQNHDYQQAIVIPNSWKSGLIPYLAKIPQRTGWLGEMRYGLLNDHRRLDKARYPLMIERLLALSEPANTLLNKPYPKPKFVIDEKARQQAINGYWPDYDETKSVLALCPGAQYGPAKQWPAQHFAQVAKQKQQQGWQVVLFGGPNDKSISAAIQNLSANACTDLTGKTSLSAAIDLLSLATQIVTNDSGLMHVAAALAKPLVAVYGSSSPDFTPPLADSAKVLSLNLSCSPCFKRECPLGHLKCLLDLKPEQVIEALDE